MAVSTSSQTTSSSGTILREIVFLFITLVCSIAIVAAIIFAPRVFIDSAPLQGSAARTNIGMEHIVPYVQAIGDYTLGVLKGNLGQDRRGTPVSRSLLPAMRRTLELLAVSVAVAIPLGLAWGASLAAVRGRTLRTVLFGLNTLMLSIPTFMLAFLAIEGVATLTLRTGFRLTYVQGYGLDRHLVLPVAVLAVRGASYMARGIQVAQEEIAQQDWIRAARAKGLGGFALWRRHMLPALRVPLLGSTLGMFRVIVGGIVIVDYLYNWNGIGTAMLKSVGIIVARSANDQLAAGAVVLLVLLVVAIDAIGRLALRGVDPRLRGSSV